MKVVWLFAWLLTMTFAYVPCLPSSREATTTQLCLFNKNNNNKKSPQKPNNSNENKKKNNPDEKKTEPFIFLYGKPQYDWTTGKPIAKDSWVTKKRQNWLVKPKE